MKIASEGVRHALSKLLQQSPSKIHCLADDRGRPVALALTPGNVADLSMAMPLLEAVAPSRRLIADKAFDVELAFESGLHRTYISAVERGVRNPTITVVEKMAKALKVPASRLLDERR